jgi:hypothetical protein
MNHWEWIFLGGLAVLAIVLWAVAEYRVDMDFDAHVIKADGRGGAPELCRYCGEPMDPYSGHNCPESRGDES